MSSGTSVSGGIGFGGLLCIVLIVLKVLEKIEMSWLLVLSSWLWGPILIFAAVLSLIGIGIGLFWLSCVAWEALKVKRKRT